jgi:hypothetical protein
MGYAENAGSYWRARYRTSTRRLATVRDPVTGRPVHFDTKREAKRAAERAEAASAIQEAQSQEEQSHPATNQRTTFGEYVRSWYNRQDLAASTMQNYRRHIENHLLPTFEEDILRHRDQVLDLGDREITHEGVDLWEKAARKAGYAESSIKTWRGTLHLILSDAETEGLILANPAAKRRGRGKRAGKLRVRGPEKVITNTLSLILIAERASLLSGRDDEFVGIVTKGTTGVRFGELVGLESDYVRPGTVRIEWQLYELDNGEFVRCPPKDDSYRTIDTPDFLTCLLREHIERTTPKSCGCHGRTYVFSGHRPANKAARTQGAKLVDVARLAGVSAGTVSNVLNRPETVSASTRDKVVAAVAQLGYVRAVRRRGTLLRTGDEPVSPRGCFSQQ